MQQLSERPHVLSAPFDGLAHRPGDCLANADVRPAYLRRQLGHSLPVVPQPVIAGEDGDTLHVLRVVWRDRTAVRPRIELSNSRTVCLAKHLLSAVGGAGE